MDADFPAAHSMDTAFFAVDQDGHVALFDTGENGILPAEAVDLMNDAGEEANTDGLPITELVPSLSGRSLPGPYGELHVPIQPRVALERVALLLTSLDLVKPELSARRARRLVTAEGEAVYFARLSPALARQIHKAGHCRMCNSTWLWEEDEKGPGLFHYEALDDCGEAPASSPYGRFLVPREPIHIDQFPPRLRQLVRRFPVRIRFAEAPHVQPAEHSKSCHAWGSGAYLSADGLHIRALPRDAATFAEQFAEIRKALDSDPRGQLIQLEEPAKRKPVPKRKKR